MSYGHALAAACTAYGYMPRAAASGFSEALLMPSHWGGRSDTYICGLEPCSAAPLSRQRARPPPRVQGLASVAAASGRSSASSRRPARLRPRVLGLCARPPPSGARAACSCDTMRMLCHRLSSIIGQQACQQLALLQGGLHGRCEAKSWPASVHAVFDKGAQRHQPEGDHGTNAARQPATACGDQSCCRSTTGS
jgi:hypothetical protein